MKQSILIIASVIFASLSVSIATQTIVFEYIPSDMDGDGDIDFNDFILFASEFGKPVEELTVKRVSKEAPSALEDEVQELIMLSRGAGWMMGYWAIYGWSPDRNGRYGWRHHVAINFNNYGLKGRRRDTTYIWGKPADIWWINDPYGRSPAVYARKDNRENYIDAEIAVFRDEKRSPNSRYVPVRPPQQIRS